jgi:hypothetical protein
MATSSAVSSSAASFSFVTPVPNPHPGFPAAFTADTTNGTYFHLTGSITIDGFGFWDADQDGLASAYRIGLWDGFDDAPFTATPNLLLEGTIAAGVASPLVDGWRFVDLPDLELEPGYFVLGALKLDAEASADLGFVQSTDFSSFPGLIPEVDLAAYALTQPQPGRGFRAPETFISLGGAFGPTLFVVPEPGTALGVALGLAAIGRVRRGSRSPHR